MSELEENAQPLVFRYEEDSDLPPSVPVEFIVVDNSQIIPATVRPDLPVTTIAAQWASALDLSSGAAALVQLSSGFDDDAASWGPCEMITPFVDRKLDAEINADAVGGLLLGQDLLSSMVVAFFGPARCVVFMRSEPTE